MLLSDFSIGIQWALYLDAFVAYLHQSYTVMGITAL